MIQIEVNPAIPPPLKFAIQYDPRFKHGGGIGFFRLLCLVPRLAVSSPRLRAAPGRSRRDRLARQDAILVKQEYLSLFGVEGGPVDERALFMQEPAAAGNFREVGVDSTVWRNEPDPHALLSDVWDACVAASVKSRGEVLPFILTL